MPFYLEDWGFITLQALQNAWEGFLLWIPRLLGAIVVFVIGWVVATVIGKIVAEALKRLTVDQVFKKTSWVGALESAQIKVTPSEFIGAIFKWILVIVFLSAAVEIIGFVQFADILSKVIEWLPNLIVAVAIFVVAIIIADILEKIVKASVKKIGVGYTEFLGVAVKWTIYVFSALAILLQLGVTPTIINTLIVGFVGMISLAFGLAFGLGGKDAAGRAIEDVRKKISEK